MVELNIRITGDDLLNEKVDSVIKAVRQLQSSEAAVETAPTEPKKKVEIKQPKEDKKEPVKKEKKDEPKQDINIEEKNQEEDNADNLDTLRATTKAYFIKLAKKDRLKAKEILDNYGAESFTELSEVFKCDTGKWDSCLKLLMEYVG